MRAICSICPHSCSLAPGELGRCGARRHVDGRVMSISHGEVTSMALDPIEKKPLARFHPGSMILSVGSFGCNLSCPFCQNHEIATARGKRGLDIARHIEPTELVELAESLRTRGNIGIAYTYNEPFIGWEFLRDTMELVHDRGMLNVVVTNGYINEQPLLELLEYADALNIDLKGNSQDFYDLVGAPRGLQVVKRAIELASSHAHVEVTTLVVPGENDSEDEMDGEAAWLAGIDPDTCLHITRFFPRHLMPGKPMTPIATLERLAEVASRHLDHVVIGNA